jgi:hypothetical protein
MKRSMPVTPVPNGVRIAVRVQPRASRDALVGVHDGALKIALTAPPVDGEANAALVAFVAAALGVPRRDVRIARGETSKTKVLEVVGVTEDAVRRWIG